jgi:hypothetical protein
MTLNYGGDSNGDSNGATTLVLLQGQQLYFKGNNSSYYWLFGMVIWHGLLLLGASSWSSNTLEITLWSSSFGVVFFCFCVLLRFLMFVALFVLFVCVCGFVFVALFLWLCLWFLLFVALFVLLVCVCGFVCLWLCVCGYAWGGGGAPFFDFMRPCLHTCARVGVPHHRRYV